MRTNMKIIALSLVATVLALNLSACGFRAHKRKKIEQELQQQPISCATAEGDLRVLKSEKAHVAEQIAMGVTSIIPIGLVVGVVTLTEWEKIKISTGEYNKKIDKKIAEIKQECNIE
jgi:cell division protein ZapA (FtsZ GTPase activity inhibitor)